ncbi:MAG: UDP-glucose/GDP-mannose dehydrogenase family protein [Candidatus Margulisiibacteriota bacterium]
MKLCVIGTGYVGLVVGACFADMGNHVICVDKDEKKLDKLKAGIIPIYEPGLENIVSKNSAEGRLSFSSDLDSAVKDSLVCFIAVGTPPGEDGSADLKHVIEVAKSIGQAMNEYKVIVNKSTVPVGTADVVREVISKETDIEFDVVSNPEFLKEGAAIADFMSPPRVVIGTNSKKAEKVIEELYEPFNRTGKPILIMSNRSAEMTKYAANAMLATRISFMNEMANLCEKVGADIDDIRQGLATDPRIGSKFLFAGVGYGGSCFPKDVKAIIKTGDQMGSDLKVLNAVEEANLKQKTVLLDKINTYFNGRLSGKKIAIWGLSFKPNTDDMREAPAVEIIKGLIKSGAVIKVYDPAAIEEAKKVFGDSIEYGSNCYDVLKDADALVIVTEWNEFRYPDFNKMIELMKSSIIFDGRNLYNRDMLKGYKIKAYYSIGRG